MIKYFSKTVKLIFLTIVIMFSISINNNLYSQVPDIIIDGTPTLVGDLSMFPYWLSSGQTLEVGTKVNSISVLQYIISPISSGGNDLIFESIIKVTSQQTVPPNKAWKIESVGFDLTAATIGVTGPTGPTGADGIDGVDGINGVTGATPVLCIAAPTFRYSY